MLPTNGILFAPVFRMHLPTLPPSASLVTLASTVFVHADMILLPLPHEIDPVSAALLCANLERTAWKGLIPRLASLVNFPSGWTRTSAASGERRARVAVSHTRSEWRRLACSDGYEQGVASYVALRGISVYQSAGA